MYNMGTGRKSRTQGGFEKLTRGLKKVEAGLFKSGDRVPKGWRRAAPG